MKLIRHLVREIMEAQDEPEGEELDYAEEIGDDRPAPLPPRFGPVPKGIPDREKANLNIWFEGSQIKKKDGSPLRVFHGTNAIFSTFRVASGGMYGPGIYFTDDPKVASDYAKTPGGYGKSSEALDSSPSIIPAYLRVIRPFVIPSGNPDPNLSYMVKQSGYDGIVVRSPGHPFHIVVVFDPRQVKSAMTNAGDYSWSSEDITNESHA